MAMFKLFIVFCLVATVVGCAGGDPLPRPIGPREPLNGWQPIEQATEQQ
jgi:hypothetical protein